MLLISKHHEVTRQSLNVYKTPTRPETKIWKGISHGALATAVMNEVKDRGLTLIDSRWALSKDRHRLTGVLTFDDPIAEIPADASPTKFSLGIRHSNMGQYALSFATGARVVVCDNGVFSGAFVVKHRHTTGLDLGAIVKKGFDAYLERTSEVSTLISRYLDVPMSNPLAAYGVMQLVADGALKNRYADDVWREWMTPRHAAFEPRNLWSLYNAITEVAKGMTPDIQYRLLSRAKPVIEATYFSEEPTP